MRLDILGSLNSGEKCLGKILFVAILNFDIPLGHYVKTSRTAFQRKLSELFTESN